MGDESSDGIVCVLDSGREVVLPASSVDRIVDYEVAQLPLARAQVAGVAMVDGESVVSIRLDDEARESTRRSVRRTSGALLIDRLPEGLRCSIEVARVLGMVRRDRASFVDVRELLSTLRSGRLA